MSVQGTEAPEAIGDRLYQIKDYNGSVRWFTKALEQISEKLHYQIYLKRAAALIKLEKYDAAVRDGGNAVRLAPQEAGGYLRLGQALQRQVKNERAIAILESGLRRMKSGSSNWKLISRHLEEARVRLNLILKRRDFLDDKNRFPLELVIQIFKYLDQKTILRCMRVCKGWRTTIKNNPEFFQSLEIRKHIPQRALGRWLTLTENSPYKLKNLKIKLSDSIANPRHKHLMVIGKACKQLESLNIHIQEGVKEPIHLLYPAGSDRMKSLVLDSSFRGGITMTDIEIVMARLPALEQAVFIGVTQSRDNAVLQWPEMARLKSIVLVGHDNILPRAPETMLAINNLIVAAPNVTRATIRNFGISSAGSEALDFAAWSSLETLDMAKLRILRLPTFPQTLRSLDLSHIATVAYPELARAKQTKEAIDGGPFHLPHLEHLNVEGSDFTNFGYQLSLAGLASGTLTELRMGDTCHIAGHEDPYNDWPLRMPGPSNTLRELSLNQLGHIPEDMIIRLLQQYPNLETIDISNCTITGTTLRMLWQRETKPRLVQIVGCQGMVSRDAIEAARHHGIAIETDVPVGPQTFRENRYT